MTKPIVFLIDDEQSVRTSMRTGFEIEGFEVSDFSNAQDMLKELPDELDGLIVSDVKMPGMNGIELLSNIKEIDADLPVILITGHGDIDMAVNAMQLGAYDFIEKPFQPERLIEAARRGLEKRKLVLENRKLRNQVVSHDRLSSRLVGISDQIRRLREEISGISATDASILLIGETGTGKEVVARCLHDLSQRANGPFVAINSAAIPETTAESEFFGHEKGAFTGAYQNHTGSLVRAENGTLFLDEIISMPMGLQAKLLRALQENEVQPLGGYKTIPTNFRLISAANEDITKAIDDKRIRQDLYYRINTVEIRLPPLRDRRQDIALLFRCFADNAAETYDRPHVFLNNAELGILMSHDWPGNVRELKNVAERIVLSNLPENDRMSVAMHVSTSNAAISNGSTLDEQMQHFERQVIRTALKRHNGKISQVMDELGVPRRTLNSKMVRLGITRYEDDTI